VIVALRALGLGDFLTGVPALRALRAHFAGEALVLAAPAALAPLVELSGAVDELADTAPLAPLSPRLHGAVVAVNLHGRGPQSHARLRETRPGRLVAFAAQGHEGPAWRADEHEVTRWCRLLTESAIPADPSPGRLRIAVPPDPAAAGATLLHPGAASPARRWPPERWAAIARAERERGRPVLLTGSAAERPLAEAVAAKAGLPPGAVRAGETDLAGLASLVAGAARIASGDTGVSHLATATGTPSVTLFGPVPPAEWGPPPLARHRALWAGRRGDPHGGAPDPGLLELGVERVDAELAAL
jgi:ADP-heptose:LPS heptosyltransferase